MPYKTTKEIKSLARGGVSLGANQPCTPQAFTPTLWAALIKEGSIVEIEQPKENAIYPNAEANATKTAVELADKHRLQLYSVKGTGKGGKITLSDVRALVVED